MPCLDYNIMKYVKLYGEHLGAADVVRKYCGCKNAVAECTEKMTTINIILHWSKMIHYNTAGYTQAPKEQSTGDSKVHV